MADCMKEAHELDQKFKEFKTALMEAQKEGVKVNITTNEITTRNVELVTVEMEMFTKIEIKGDE